MLRTILDKYEQFSLGAGDRVDLEFESEVAWLYFKMANYHERLGNREDADHAFDRGLMIFDKLAAEYARQPLSFDVSSRLSRRSTPIRKIPRWFRPSRSG